MERDERTSVARPSQRGVFGVEYVVLIVVVVATLLGMAVYTMRALCGRWRDVGDAFGHGRQFEPGVTVIQ